MLADFVDNGRLMRRLVILSILVALLFAFASWLVLPMFVAPKEGSLAECAKCEALLGHVPAGVERVVVIPRGGTTLFELGRRIVPGPDLAKVLPAPGLLAIGLGNAPVVAWQDNDGLGAVSAPSGVREVLVRLAAYRYGGETLRWSDGVLVLGTTAAADKWNGSSRFDPVREARGHLFAVHERPAGASVGLLGPTTLKVRTLPLQPSPGVPGIARHPSDAVVSLVLPDVGSVIGPVEDILPMKSSSLRGRRGQFVVYEVESSGLLPSIRGLVVVEGALDARTTLEESVPRVEGATRDSRRTVGEVEVFRRETLGLVVETATVEGALLIAFDGSSMDLYLAGERRADPVPSIWSFSADPARLASAIDGLSRSPSRVLVRSSARRTMKQLGEVAGALRNATVVESRLVQGESGPEIETRVQW